VVGSENTPYGVVVSREDQAEYERGLAKTSGNFKEHEQQFWEGYFAFADKKWHEILKEINEAEYVEGCKRLKLPFLPQTASVHAWRKDAEKRFQTEEEKRAFWQAANWYRQRTPA